MSDDTMQKTPSNHDDLRWKHPENPPDIPEDRALIRVLVWCPEFDWVRDKPIMGMYRKDTESFHFHVGRRKGYIQDNRNEVKAWMPLPGTDRIERTRESLKQVDSQDEWFKRIPIDIKGD